MNEEREKMEQPVLNPHPLWGLDLGERWGREVGELSQRLTNVDQAVNRLEIKTDKLEAKIDAVEARLEAKIDAVEAKLEAKIDAVEAKLDAKIDAVEAKLEAKIDAVEAKVDIISLAIGRLDERGAAQAAAMEKMEKALQGANRLLWGLFTALLAAIIIQKFI